MTRIVFAALAIALVRFVDTQSDALTDLRNAMGGEAALTGIRSIRVTGKVRAPNRQDAGHVEMSFQHPDKFVRITRLPPGMSDHTSEGRLLIRDVPGAVNQEPLSTSRMTPDLNQELSMVAARSGFNGARSLSSGEGMSITEANVGGARRQYARFVIPLMTITTAAYGTTTASQPGRVSFTADDGITWSLALDPLTRLPATLSWIGVTPDGQPIPRAQWSTAFSDFRKVDHVTWPHRWVTSLGGKVVEDVLVDKFELNKPISPKVFK
jgi:hypothetical protein